MSSERWGGAKNATPPLRGSGNGVVGGGGGQAHRCSNTPRLKGTEDGMAGSGHRSVVGMAVRPREAVQQPPQLNRVGHGHGDAVAGQSVAASVRQHDAGGVAEEGDGVILRGDGLGFDHLAVVQARVDGVVVGRGQVQVDAVREVH